MNKLADHVAGEFNVDDIGDTTWLDTPFDNLVLPEGEKDLVFAFASHPRLHKNGFDDFVEQKGLISNHYHQQCRHLTKFQARASPSSCAVHPAWARLSRLKQVW